LAHPALFIVGAVITTTYKSAVLSVNTEFIHDVYKVANMHCETRMTQFKQPTKDDERSLMRKLAEQRQNQTPHRLDPTWMTAFWQQIAPGAHAGIGWFASADFQPENMLKTNVVNEDGNHGA
jgi:hypothetical protein